LLAVLALLLDVLTPKCRQNST